MENTDNSIINSLKRLERVGSESSKATEKLKDACIEMADYITSLSGIADRVADIPDGLIELPRGYAVGWPGCDRRSDVYLYSAPNSNHYGLRHAISSRDADLRGTLGLDRYIALKFAADIASGLLDEIADWLESRTKKDNEASEQIKNARTR
jgi:hypothetical protein